MNAIKTPGRSTLGQQNLLNQLRIVTCGPSVKDFDPTDSVNLWLNSCSGSGSRHLNHKPRTKPFTATTAAAADVQPGSSTTMSPSATATTATPDSSSSASTDLFSEAMIKLGDSATRDKLKKALCNDKCSQQ